MMNNIKTSMRGAFGEAIVELGKENPDVVVLTADMRESTHAREFSKQFPTRFFDVGVAEQNLAGVAAGMAMEGQIPFITSYAVFSPGRNWEQIRQTICYSKLNVKIIGSHAGISVGPDGATHQGLEDLALLRVLPNMTIFVPADATQAKMAVRTAAAYNGPVYIRLARPDVPEFYGKETPFIVGGADVVREGTDVTVIACGEMVYRALKAAEKLLRGEFPLSAEVINAYSVKPLDGPTILASAKKTGRVVVAEDHQKIGGLGSAVCEFLSEKHPVSVQRVGINDVFGESGEAEELSEKYHIGIDDIVRAVLDMVQLK